jgi:hypothetical protein
VGGAAASVFLPGGGYGKAGKFLAKEAAEELAVDASKQGVRVIGHYPAYTDTAKRLNAKVFSVPEPFWKALSDPEKWIANKKFLDRAIAGHNPFLLATPRDKIRRGSDFEREVKYLLENGYTWSKDGTMLIWKQ